MSDLKAQISESTKTAMKARDKERVAVLRMVNAELKQKEVDERIELSDEQTLAILDKMAKQHRDSITQFEKANRNDLVEVEQKELDIIEEYLPVQLSVDEINTFIDDAISKTGADSIKDMGKVMGVLKGQLQGRADMGKVSGLIKARLNS